MKSNFGVLAVCVLLVSFAQAVPVGKTLQTQVAYVDGIGLRKSKGRDGVSTFDDIPGQNESIDELMNQPVPRNEQETQDGLHEHDDYALDSNHDRDGQQVNHKMTPKKQQNNRLSFIANAFQSPQSTRQSISARGRRPDSLSLNDELDDVPQPGDSPAIQYIKQYRQSGDGPVSGSTNTAKTSREKQFDESVKKSAAILTDVLYNAKSSPSKSDEDRQQTARAIIMDKIKQCQSLNDLQSVQKWLLDLQQFKNPYHQWSKIIQQCADALDQKKVQLQKSASPLQTMAESLTPRAGFFTGPPTRDNPFIGEPKSRSAPSTRRGSLLSKEVDMPAQKSVFFPKRK